jgi:hypothetical protein
MARKGTETGGPAETKAAKFSRLASARVTRAVKAINRVGALRNYTIAASDVEGPFIKQIPKQF